MKNDASVETGKDLPWPFPVKDSYAGVRAHHRLPLIHSLPGVLLWPVILFVLTFIAGFLAGVIWALAGGENGPVPMNTLVLLFVSLAYGVLGLMFWSWLSKNDLGHRSFSIWPGSINDIGIALLAVAAGILIGGPLSLAFHEFAMSDPSLTLSGGANPDDISNADDFLNTGAATWTIILSAVIAAPIIEEVIFRGWMQPMMISRGMPAIFAVLITALFFGLVHVFSGLQVMTYTFLLGIALGMARLITGRVAAPMLAHMANNAWALFAVPKLLEMQAG